MLARSGRRVAISTDCSSSKCQGGPAFVLSGNFHLPVDSSLGKKVLEKPCGLMSSGGGGAHLGKMKNPVVYFIHEPFLIIPIEGRSR